MSSRHHACVAIAALSLCLAASAEGREPWLIDDEITFTERIDISADFRTRYEHIWGQFRRLGSGGNDQMLVLRTRIRAGVRLTDWLQVAAELQDSRAYLHDSSGPINTTFVNAAELLRAYLELSIDGPFDGAQRLQFGRITMDFGSRRLIARNRFRNTANAFTGLDWQWTGAEGRVLRAFYVLPIRRLPVERQRLRDNDVAFDEENFDRQFFGFYFADRLPWGAVGEVYGYTLRERTRSSAPNRNRKLFTPGLRLDSGEQRGRVDYEIESVLQLGKSRLVASGLEDLRHVAHFQHVEVGYTFDTSWRPRLSLHYDYASGDRDPDDGDNDRFDTLFGARRFELGPTSIYGAFARTNINSPGLRLRVAPLDAVSGFFMYRPFWLAEKKDFWVPAGVRDPTGRSGSFVGHQVELRLRYQLLPGNVGLEAGYAHLFAGGFIERAPDAYRGDSDYVYVQLVANI